MSSKQKKKTKSSPIKSPVQQENGRKNAWKGFNLFFPVVIMLTGIIIYSNTFDCSFHFDDYNIIESNVVKESAGIKDWINLFPGRPVGILTFALNYHFHKLHVWGYHFINLTIHLVNALVVWWLTLLTLSTPKMKDEAISRQKSTVAFIVALLFVSHPLATQSVTYIVQRFSSLATMFYLLSLALYVKGRLWQRGRNVSRFFYGVSIVCAVLGMLTKEIVFTLPFAILLYEFCFLKTDAWKIDLKD
ncbi:MAG: hypothetical protein L7F78_10120, partial [Syntrophales bacterium LBB04]|nr:hypothetical protein [Syntrophales bacterium LBB04]